MTNRHPLNNPELAGHTFLQDMYDDDYIGLNLKQYGVACLRLRRLVLI